MVASARATARRFLLDGLRERWRHRAQLRSWMVRGPKTDLDADDLDRIVEQMRACLEARGGEASARSRAVELGSSYLALSESGRMKFLSALCSAFDVDHEAVAAAAASLARAPGVEERGSAERALRLALEPPRIQLLAQFNALPEGPKFLVDLRADLLDFSKSDSSLIPLEKDLRSLLAGWFDIGFLELRRITWDSPASLLEKLAYSEAVHAVTSWDDLKDRLDTDRRLFAFFHPRMPEEPIIFVEVALVRGLAVEIAPLLDPDAPLTDLGRADTAIFYSISNAQPGLAGISFGGFLIKRVVDELSTEFSRMKTFATLSPIPGFRAWFDHELATKGRQVLRLAERQQLAAVTGSNGGESVLAELLTRTDWPGTSQLESAMRVPLMRACASFLLEAKRGDGRALDHVANFHLSNGARIERINWLADPSRKGLTQSAGIMVNYLYSLPDIETNHEAYTGHGAVAASSAVKRIAREGKT